MDSLFVVLFWCCVIWACWRWFLKAWVMSLPIVHSLRGRFLASKISEEAYYAQAAHEVRNNIISEGLWAKAWSDAHGDEIQAKALYIRYRVEDMRRQTADKFAGISENGFRQAEKVIISCQHCGAGLRVAAGKCLDVSCPKCGKTFRTFTASRASS